MFHKMIFFESHGRPVAADALNGLLKSPSRINIACSEISLLTVSSQINTTESSIRIMKFSLHIIIYLAEPLTVATL